MTIYPAIDLSGGQVVRLTQGDFDQKTVYAQDPVPVAEGFLAAGATHLHVVDLDGAKDGAPRSGDALARLTRLPLFIQTGGGIRTAERVRQLLDLGVSRVILGTAALSDPDFLSRMIALHGDKIAVGVDAKGGKVAVAGWLTVSDTDATTFCVQLHQMGVKTIIYTDIARDGGLSGPNFLAYEALLSALEGMNLIASGGVSKLSDVERLSALGTPGAIIGKALYEGRIDLKEALAV